MILIGMIWRFFGGLDELCLLETIMTMGVLTALYIEHRGVLGVFFVF
jgi:hypothetical protein